MATGAVAMINAVAILDARLYSIAMETRRAIRERPAGMTEHEAFLVDLRANALERLRVSSVLPSLPDDLESMFRKYSSPDRVDPERACRLPLGAADRIQ